MKMRKKLAALLAAAMIASVMPMTAFAASSNHVTQIERTTDKGNVTKPVLQVTMKDDLLDGEKFYLKLENAKWAADVANITTSASINGRITTGVFDIERASDTELAVTVNDGHSVDKDDWMKFTLNTTDVKGEAKVTVEPWDSVVSKSEHIFAIATTAKASVTVKEDDAPSFYTGNNLKLATFTIEEAAAGAIAADDNGKLTFTLDNDDYEFLNGVVAGDVKYSKGFAGMTAQPTFRRNSKDKQVIEVDFGTITQGKADRGVVEITLVVDSVERKPSVGDLKVEISGDLVDTKTFKAATIAEHGVELKADKKDYEFFAGRQEKVVFHLNEIVDDSMVSNRVTEFSLPEGVYFAKEANSIELKDGTGSPVKWVYKDNDSKKEVTGFEIDLTTTNKVDKFKFEAKLDITSDFAGDIVLKAEGRSIGQDVEAVIATVKPALEVTIEPMTVKVGLKEQTGGKITIKELEKGALQQGKNIFVALEKESGIYITDADVEVIAGDLKLGDLDKGKTTKDAITVEVKRKSREASTVELTNIKVKLDRTVPEGAYELKVGGAAVSVLADKNNALYGNDNITAKDFLFVGEKYTRAEVVFNIGSNKFLVNGKEVEMDAAAYIKDGRTMVPVRYLATALGIDTESIKFSAGVVTIFDDARVIQLQTGSKNLVINGMTIPMVAAAEIIEGRTYVPVTEIGSVFGVTGTWDAATQTATFK